MRPFSPFKEGETIHHPHRIQWTEDSYLDMPSDRAPTPSAFLGTFQNHRRLRFFSFSVGFLFLLYLARIFFLQIIAGHSYAVIADQNRIRVITERASRGLVVDVRDRPLVTNKPEFILTVTPNALPRDVAKRAALYTRIGELLHESPLTITEEISALPRDPLIRRQALPFREHIDYSNALQFFAAETSLSGFQIATREQRAYPDTYTNDTGAAVMPESIAHIIGYLGKISTEELPVLQAHGYLASDLTGKSGIERSFDYALHGKHGKRFIEIDALGEQKISLRNEEPIAGEQLRLSIDLDLQRSLETAIANAVAPLPRRDRRGASGIIMDPRSGEIRALVSYPTYNPKIFSTKTAGDDINRLLQDPAEPLFFRAISGVYPSGSTIKPLIALAALEEGIITPATTVLSVGGIHVGPWFFPDWKSGGHGVTDVKKAIAESVNTFFYAVSGGYGNISGLGIDHLDSWLEKFYFGKPLGLNLPNEASGLVPNPDWKKSTRQEPWYIGDTYHLGIGQGDILVTPLQIASMTSFFANGGILWQPTIQATKTPIAIAKNIASLKNINVVREAMRRTVTSGSARLLSLLPRAVAGKTGTAEWSSKAPPHAWFTGFAPYENPELVITILVEEGGEGSSIAVPIARTVLAQYFAERQKR